MKRNNLFSAIRMLNLAALYFMSLGALNAVEITTLEEAIELAIDNSLKLKQADARIQMKWSECLQSGLLPNPIFTAQVNGMPLCGGSVFNGQFAISQLIERGGKRTARQNLDATEALIAAWEWEFIKEQLVHDLTDTFIDLSAARKKMTLLIESRENMSKIMEYHTEKAINGKVSSLQSKKCLLSCHSLSNELNKTETQISNLTKRLNLLCGEVCHLNLDIDAEFILKAPLPLSYYLCLIPNSAELMQMQATQEASYYNYLLQKANKYSDLVVTAGLGNDDNIDRGNIRSATVMIGIGFALPVFNRNQGNICRASWEGYSLLYKLQDRECELLAQGHQIYSEWIHAYETVDLLSSTLISIAEEVLESHSHKESCGKQDCLERLEAKKDLFDLQFQHIDAVKEYHHLKADLRFLCGADMTD